MPVVAGIAGLFEGREVDEKQCVCDRFRCRYYCGRSLKIRLIKHNGVASLSRPLTSQSLMSQYKRESHLRSLLKGISWRIIATLDTIVVALLAIWLLKDEFSLNHALRDAVKIGFYEFFIKLAVYYVHERIWEQARSGDGLDRSRTLKKSVSWRIVATSMTFVIAGTVLESYDNVALAIAIIEFFTKFTLYYIHERVWLKLPLGRIRSWLWRR